MFYEACRCGGVDDTQAKMMYYAVYHFGPRWEVVADPISQPGDGTAEQSSQRRSSVQRVARIDPPPPTNQEVLQVRDFVEEENPRPEEIRDFDRVQLHRRRGKSSPQNATAGRSDDFASRWDNHERSERSGRRRIGRSGMRPETEDAVIATVREHVEAQTGELRPAVYSIEPDATPTE